MGMCVGLGTGEWEAADLCTKCSYMSPLSRARVVMG